MNIDNLTAETILDESIFMELFDISDIIERERVHQALQEKAKLLGVKTKFDGLYSTHKKLDKEMRQAQRAVVILTNQETVFDVEGSEYQNMKCGSWIAREDGIYAQNSSGVDVIACYHPIIPVERLKNLETGEEQITLAFKRNYTWSKITVEKTLIASANRIVQLAKVGVAVTSENARLLVRYLADVENLNPDLIGVKHSTSKMGWHDKGKLFIPFDTDVVFDGNLRFRQICSAIRMEGDYDTWLNEVKRIRASGRIEAKFLLASSFASVLLEQLGALPFFVDLWGETEGGKTVALMLATSVWADPADSKYIGDFKSTDVALEAKADMLNNLPMMLDDTSKVSRRISENFEGVIYDLCSGKGKSRSNRELGVNRENHWHNIFICNGERPLNSYVDQGGAINRILEVECEPNVFEDPQRTAELVKRNYGYAGFQFVKIIQNTDPEGVKAIFHNFQNQLMKSDGMQKQATSLAVVLTADMLIEKYIFRDGKIIQIGEAKKMLLSRSNVSDNERCYQFLLSKIEMNSNRFEEECKVERWGIIEGDSAYIFPPVLATICKDGGFSRESFVSWGLKHGKIRQDGRGKNSIQKKIGGRNTRVYCIDISGADADEDDYMQISLDEIPFEDMK